LKQAVFAGAGLILLCSLILMLGLGRGQAAPGKASMDQRVAALEASVGQLQATVGQQQATITALQAKLAKVTVSADGNDITISGANLHIVNGMGSTDAKPFNGLGNLIIGYNESRKEFREADVRTGSHNLIVGSQNNYSSYAGICVGNYDTISAPFAAVSGGYENTASGFSSSVLGGSYNTASGREASVSGGLGNTASGSLSCVGGGYNVSNDNGYGWSAGGNYAPGTGAGQFKWP
jgi:hypothetical protein